MKLNKKNVFGCRERGFFPESPLSHRYRLLHFSHSMHACHKAILLGINTIHCAGHIHHEHTHFRIVFVFATRLAPPPQHRCDMNYDLLTVRAHNTTIYSKCQRTNRNDGKFSCRIFVCPHLP